MIELVNVSKVYQETHALKNIHFSVQPGEIVGIVGKSGSGKSTLLRLLNLMEQPSEGEIRIDGRNVQTFSKKEVRQQQQQMGMVFQHYNLLENLKIYDNVALPLKLLKEKQPEKIERLLTFVDMAHKAEAYPAQLSGGEKQRVSIARALSRNPKWLLCDSHELETVKRLCNRILVMEKGQLIGEFLNNPQQYEEEPLSYLEKVERSLRP